MGQTPAMVATQLDVEAVPKRPRRPKAAPTRGRTCTSACTACLSTPCKAHRHEHAVGGEDEGEGLPHKRQRHVEQGDGQEQQVERVLGGGGGGGWRTALIGLIG